MSKFALDVYALGLQSANTKTAEESTRLIDLVGEAQKYVSAKRSLFGAYQNRLEHTYAIRSQMKEDTTAAESRIRDTDMAEEMVAYSANKVLLQAGQSMIAQANQQGDGVLRLLA
ncbi:MAG: flagellin [Lachnospiraceae bacterium]|nr:flagellin [Lachnospiraceae bacterium]